MSVRITLRASRGFELLIEADDESLGGAAIQPKPASDDSLSLKLAIGRSPDAGCSERDLNAAGDNRDVDEGVRRNADDAAVEHRGEVFGLLNHVELSGWFSGRGILNGVDLLAKPQSHGEAA